MAGVRKRYYPKRQVINMSLVNESDYADKVIVCIPKFAWDVARSFWAEQCQYRTTYSIEYHEDYYYAPDDVALDIIIASIDEALAGDDMSCDLEVAINNVANQIEKLVNKQCCPTGGAEGIVYQGYLDDGTPIMGNAPMLDDIGEGVGDPPEGYATWEEYYTHKCRVANNIVTRSIEFLNNLSTISGLEAVLASIALAAICTWYVGGVPGAVFGGLLAIIFVLSGAQFVIADVADAIESDYDSWVCGIYNSASTQAVLDWVASKIDEILETVVLAGNLHWAIKAIAAFLYSTDIVNQLFEFGIATEFALADCSGCEEPGVGVLCYDFETENSLLGWTITDQTGTVSLDTSGGGLTAIQSGAGLSLIEASSPAGLGYTIQEGDIWYIESMLEGGQISRNIKVVFTDATEVSILGGGTVNPYVRQTDQLLMTPYAGKTVDYFVVYQADSQDGSRTLVVYYSCFNSAP